MSFLHIFSSLRGRNRCMLWCKDKLSHDQRFIFCSVLLCFPADFFSAVWMYERYFSFLTCPADESFCVMEHKIHKMLQTEMHRLII